MGWLNILTGVSTGIQIAQSFRSGAKGKEKHEKAMEEIVKNPLVDTNNSELKRLIDEELIPLLVRMAHLSGGL